MTEYIAGLALSLLNNEYLHSTFLSDLATERHVGLQTLTPDRNDENRNKTQLQQLAQRMNKITLCKKTTKHQENTNNDSFRVKSQVHTQNGVRRLY